MQKESGSDRYSQDRALGYLCLVFIGGAVIFVLCVFFTSPSAQWLKNLGAALVKGPLQPSIPRAVALSCLNVVVLALFWGFGHLVFREGQGPPLSGESHPSYFRRFRGAWPILVLFCLVPGLEGAATCLVGMTDGTIQAYPVFLVNLLSPLVCFAALALTALKKK
ncbi:MAG: hypothetical protein VX675_05480 [Planctomycetota bacterium]|nr:hypothetical protein [Planctomycetota bacterium]